MSTQGPGIGKDEWVARADENKSAYAGVTAPFRRAVDRVPGSARLGGFVLAAALIPVFSSNEYVLRVGVDTLLFILLALGLNVVVGYAGLLDLGYVAFFGFGAYLYALLSSDHYGIHWPTEATIPLVIVASALLGLLLGLPSRRLVGDYLAIVTLFFGQAFVTFTTNGNEVSFLGFTGTTDLTGGPNGIPGLDAMDVLGIHIDSNERYFYFALVVFALVMTALHLVDQSRTGRAWRALREDPLAAEVMSIPVNRLKLLAFAFGAAIAGLTGTIFGALGTGVFPDDYDVPLLITIYAMLILGGAGSLTGAVVGAITINVALEVLRDGEQARWLFYGTLLLMLAATLRPWTKLAAVAGGTIAFGFAAFFVADHLRPAWTSGNIRGGIVQSLLDGWVIHPADSTRLGNFAFVALVAAVIALRQLRGPWRTAFLVPALYLAAFTWENRLVLEPSVTRLIVLGALLIALMAARPQGLLGTSRVEIA